MQEMRGGEEEMTKEICEELGIYYGKEIIIMVPKEMIEENEESHKECD